ncbi:DUF5983 family protein [Rhizobium oryzihabitans]|uniref:DUF5983 family protein n=1 Tax=Rhizobium oryzihabitans TaxID=2267833 RepID=UPI004036ECBB
MTTIAYPLRLFLDCSTAHLSSASRAYLKRHAERGEELISSTPYGWFVWVDDGELEDQPGDLHAIKAYARRLGAEYILFDRDAPETDALEIFDSSESSIRQPRETI